MFDWLLGNDEAVEETRQERLSSARRRSSSKSSIMGAGPPRKNSRLNSTGAKEEFLITAARDDDALLEEIAPEADEAAKKAKERMLLISFCCMLVVGLLNKIFNKLMTIPMYHYPNTLNLLTTCFFVIACFAYIIPMAKYGQIPQEQLDMPKKPFAVMGGLDAIAGIMQIFAATYLPGPLLILLQQSAIPVSMVISKYMLGATYNKYQYTGATIVAAGIAVVLVPTMTGGGSALWALMMIASCVPMTLSSVYKEIALGETQLDPMFLNGWIAVFQFLFSIALALPAALAGDPAVYPDKLPENIWDGCRCYVGINTVECEDDDPDDDGVCGDDCYPQAPIFVTVYLVVNFLYNLLILLILKYGSANLLWLALTLMVPLGNVAFTLDFMPQSQTLHATDIVGLVVICTGLGIYRFLFDFLVQKGWEVDATADEGDVKSPMFPEGEGRGENIHSSLLTRLIRDSNAAVGSDDIEQESLLQ